MKGTGEGERQKEREKGRTLMSLLSADVESFFRVVFDFGWSWN